MPTMNTGIARYHANRYGAKPKAEDGIAEYEWNT